MKFAKIYLIRHGEVKNPKQIIYGYLPLPLSTKGKTEAKKAGLFLKDKKIAAIFSSPQKRAQETTKIIGKIIPKNNKIKIHIEKDLRESGLGRFLQGLNWKQVSEKYPKVAYLYQRQPANLKTGESRDKMADRVLRIIKKGIKKYPGQNFAIVSHRDPIIAALLKISKRSFNDLHKVKVFCETGSVSEIDLIENKLINKCF